ncbi:RNA polymerase sigma factor [Flavonifractor sp. An306]|uniref:RNA polymerase sigma factor n=1 Tax=Flavonifractor sp. An306 TaxID=1965629 RepID=UPI0017497CB6|nr:sigma-70 family RNA polymerase sigma factor [Flavonifractor sp. An306]
MRPDQDVFFTMLYRNYFNQIKLYVLSYVSDINRAEEIAQDTFHTAMDKIDDLMKADEPIRWLKRTAKNKVSNEQRTRQRYLKRYLSIDDPLAPVLVSAISLEDEVIERDEKVREGSIEKRIQNTLSHEELSLLKSIVLEQKPYIEVSKELGISIWACQKRMQRIRKKLLMAFPKYKRK